MTRNWFGWRWQLTLLGWIAFVGVVGGGDRTVAQVTADPSVGTTVTVNGDTFEITNGTTVGGKNLFHSFSNFSIPNGGTAHFVNAPTVANILARVTGGNPSDIQGLIRAEGNANLFLMNPNGILYGSNAQLDLGGSFVATTANAIQFPGDAEFSQNSPVAADNSLLSVNPSAFLFNQIAAQPIINQSRLGLLVPVGKSLLLLGGNIGLATGKLFAPGGRIELSSVAGVGAVGLNVDEGILRLGFSDDIVRGDISLTEQSEVDVRAGSGGDIAINSRNLKVLAASRVRAGILPGLGSLDNQAGDININATGEITLADELTSISNVVQQGAIGNGGNINIVTRSLSLFDGAQLVTTTFGRGNAGNLQIEASDDVAIAGVSKSDNSRSSSLFSSVQAEAVGRGGDIEINAGTLAVTDGAQIITLTAGAGDAGDIQIKARDNITFARVRGNGLASGALTRVDINAKGRGGNINIEAETLSITDGARLSASTFGTGKAGNVYINTRDAVILTGVYLFPFRGLNIPYLSAIDSLVGIKAVGQGGDISIQTNSFYLSDGAALSTETLGQGNAGNISLQAKDSVSLSNLGAIFANVQSGAEGNGGNIDIQTQTLSLTSGSAIAVAVIGQQGEIFGGKGNGGTIRLNASDSVSITGVSSFKFPVPVVNLANPSVGFQTEGFSSGLFASTQVGASGQGGNIVVNTPTFRIADGAVVNAQTSNPSNGGNITINASDFEATNGGQILTTARSSGSAGSIILDIADNITISGSDPTFTSRLAQFSQDVVSNQGSASGIFANTTFNSSGNGGSININTTHLNLINNAQISAQSQGTGRAGTIKINATGELNANNSEITTAATLSGGGDITIAASDIRLRNDSDIRTDLTSSAGSGGNINITADSIIAFEDSDILAFAAEGQGGNITLNTPVFFGFGYRPGASRTDYAILDGNDRVDVNATGAIASGNITTPDTTLVQNSLTELPANVIDTGTLVANSCIARGSDRQQGNFIITASGGLPTRPGDTTASSYPTGTVRSVSGDRAPDASRPWQIGDPIVEPQGAYRLPNGQLVLSRECS
ncbi:filamentous hemagglutinin family outer membrane protein [Gloeocapsa sp. PCC 7428]|uniref:two-partner secretion domain-containing protein n=1 Tax=Gloeocapsa sp. PCC 7428 TaxID=1173026 RepID=UPI0002A60E33|nr:filamentous hemagglutinin N-terminal domain-containing protein [Gloeocapsa sp. PCC 7428]AFZ30818.1 filamentous hemagglutinin family outer membrane protein [Gloeocapsa sp. PCC 7428]